jgi:hypothetical protein
MKIVKLWFSHVHMTQTTIAFATVRILKQKKKINNGTYIVGIRVHRNHQPHHPHDTSPDPSSSMVVQNSSTATDQQHRHQFQTPDLKECKQQQQQ